MPPKLIIGRPSNSIIYDTLLKILKELTNCKWGYIKGRRVIRYLTSYEIPIKVGICRGKSYERNYKYLLDVMIDNSSPRHFENTNIWESVLAAELQTKLLHVIKNDQIRSIILQWKPHGEYAEMIIEADMQKNKHSSFGVAYDTWLDTTQEVTTSTPTIQEVTTPIITSTPTNIGIKN